MNNRDLSNYENTPLIEAAKCVRQAKGYLAYMSNAEFASWLRMVAKDIENMTPEGKVN